MKTNPPSNAPIPGLRFLHFRRLDRRGRPLPRGGATLAYSFARDGDYIAVCGAFAICSQADNYCRAHGRVIAEGRYRSSAFWNMFTGDHDLSTALLAFARALRLWWLKQGWPLPVPTPWSSAKNRKAAS